MFLLPVRLGAPSQGIPRTENESSLRDVAWGVSTVLELGLRQGSLPGRSEPGSVGQRL